MRACAVAILVLAVAGCAGGGGIGGGTAAVPSSALRELTDAERKIITQAVVRGQGSAQIQWTRFPASPPAEARYCAHSGGRMFAAVANTSEGRIVSAQLLAIGGGPGSFVDQECRRFYETPFT